MNTIQERTTAQPVEWMCSHATCSDGPGKPFTFTADYPTCPKCSQTIPVVQLLALVHLLVPSKDGPLPGKTGNFFLACDPKRDYTASEKNKEAATNRTSIVNCPGCIQWLRDNNLSTIQDTLLLQRK